MQYFLGYSSYIKEPPFDPSLFVDIRKGLGHQFLGDMNEMIHEFSMERPAKKEEKNTRKKNSDDDPADGDPENRGNVI
ncbi:hypothetical protein [uncultured Cyclobacterium sp.]|uniref:hypothetical protein n=1 Tax=uncultured Cyclobacterium sp. TaxID=453820 RepID=UPI0030EB37EA|tara:strand:- start:54357 stop:54590 length:234 start_codon:yes stop_codon:yes gene_type:complete